MNLFEKIKEFFNEPQTKEFINFKTIITDLLIFNYINLYDTENSVGIIGVDLQSRHQLLMYKYNSKKNQYEKSVILDHNDDISFAQQFDFTNNQKLSYLISSKNDSNNTYKIHFYDVVNKKNELIDNNSKVIPLVFSSQNNDREISFYYETEDEAFICNYKKNKIQKQLNYKFNLSKFHSSATLCINSSFKGLFFLEIENKNGDKYIELYNKIISSPNEKLEPIQIIKMPKEDTTAINFSDLRASSNQDLFFGFNSKNGPIIRIHLNTNNKEGKYFHDEPIDINIPNSLDLTFITKGKESWFLKTSISANYIEGDNYPNLMFLLENKNTNIKTLKILTAKERRTKENNKIPTTVNYSDLEPSILLPKLENAISISYIDLYNNQEELLIINSLEGATTNIYTAKKIFGKSNTHIKCSVVNGNVENKELIPIPGISIQYNLIESNILIMGTQISKSSHLHLDPPFTHVGLGNVSTCLDQIIIGPFSIKNKEKEYFKVINQQLFPNSFLVLFLKGDKITIKQFINLSFTVSVVCYVLVSVLGLNIIIFVVLLIREKIRVKKKNKSQVVSPIYESF